MKKLVGFGLLVLLSFSIKAQDTIYKTDGNTINARVMEVTQNSVSYKKASNPDGPVYTDNRSDILSIQYQNGSRDVFSSGNGSYNNGSQVVNNNYYQRPRPAVNVVVAPPIPMMPYYGGWGGMGFYGGWGRPYYSNRMYYHHRWH